MAQKLMYCLEFDAKITIAFPTEYQLKFRWSIPYVFGFYSVSLESGTTHTIKIGLNEDLAIATLQASFLEGLMSKEMFIVVITFLTTLLLALIASLLGISL